MRKFVPGFIILAVLAVAAHPAQAGVGFGLHANAANFQINSDFKKRLGISSEPSTASLAVEQIYGLGLGGGVHVDLSLPILSFRLSGDYVSIAPDNDKLKAYVSTFSPTLATQVSADGGRVTMISGNLNVKLIILPIPVFNPYVTGGIGLANIKSDDLVLNFSGTKLPGIKLLKDQTVKTLNAGVGLDLSFGGLAIYGEVKINWVFLDEGTSVQLPIATVGITF